MSNPYEEIYRAVEEAMSALGPEEIRELIFEPYRSLREETE